MILIRKWVSLRFRQTWQQSDKTSQSHSWWQAQAGKSFNCLPQKISVFRSENLKHICMKKTAPPATIQYWPSMCQPGYLRKPRNHLHHDWHTIPPSHLDLLPQKLVSWRSHRWQMHTLPASTASLSTRSMSFGECGEYDDNFFILSIHPGRRSMNSVYISSQHIEECNQKWEYRTPCKSRSSECAREVRSSGR